MIGETFRTHFLVFRLIDVLILVAGGYLVVRWRSPRVALALLTLVALTGWLLTWLPLERPYGLEPGSPTMFDAGLVASAATSGDPGEAWLRDTRSPRPGWGLLWSVLSPEQAAKARGPFSLPLRLLLPWLVYFAWAPRNREERWEAAACAFTAVFAASAILDAFRPFGPFERVFYVAPHRILALALGLGAVGLVVRGRRLGAPLAGALAGAAGWIDAPVFLWLAGGLLLADAIAILRRTPACFWRVILLGTALALPPVLALLRGNVLLRGLAPDEASGYAVAFRDAFSVTLDLNWIFFLALVGASVLWRRGRVVDLAALGLAGSAYAWWGSAAWYFGGPLLWEPETSFQLVRFSVALLAGAGAYAVTGCFWDWASALEPSAAELASWQTRLRELPREPIVFTTVAILLVPTSSILTWHPLRMDALYYPAMSQPLHPDDIELGVWLRENGSAGDVVFAGPVTSEWVAALGGRRVLNGIRVLSRERRLEQQRLLRTILSSRKPVAIRLAAQRLGASVLVLDRQLLGQLPRPDVDALETSGAFRRVHQVGDRYILYRLR